MTKEVIEIVFRDEVNRVCSDLVFKVVCKNEEQTLIYIANDFHTSLNQKPKWSAKLEILIPSTHLALFKT